MSDAIKKAMMESKEYRVFQIVNGNKEYVSTKYKLYAEAEAAMERMPGDGYDIEAV